MQLYYAAPSPFVRKCLICSYELAVRDRLELIPAAPHPVHRDRAVVARNPLGKIPALVTDSGAVLYDSRIICEYLNALGDGHLIPAEGAARWTVLVGQALADGIMDAAILARYEGSVRPEALRWQDWSQAQFDKVESGLARFEGNAQSLAGRIDVGTIALACALGYLDFRFDALAWRESHPALASWFAHFSQRESFAATGPA